mmetsp:Transcript_5406/g.13839  ORF Transcript_5406/g.13839 Transcript_5406/m.13839 type:complete len:229 (-) Transcript_5406:85-771(-)
MAQYSSPQRHFAVSDATSGSRRLQHAHTGRPVHDGAGLSAAAAAAASVLAPERTILAFGCGRTYSSFSPRSSGRFSVGAACCDARDAPELASACGGGGARGSRRWRCPPLPATVTAVPAAVAAVPDGRAVRKPFRSPRTVGLGGDGGRGSRSTALRARARPPRKPRRRPRTVGAVGEERSASCARVGAVLPPLGAAASPISLREVARIGGGRAGRATTDGGAGAAGVG